MGVKLGELVHARTTDIANLQGRIIAIDAPNIINAVFNISWRSMNPNDPAIIRDRTQRPISHLYGLLYRVLFYYSNTILPIFCFDGRDSDLKRVITKDLLNDILYTRKRYENAMNSGNFELARRIALDQDYFWPTIMKESKDLLNTIGIPVIEAPAAAEAQCAHLVKDGIAWCSNSQDYDSLLFGCPRTLQNLSKSRRRKQRGRWTFEKIVPQIIDLNANLKRLEINHFQLVDMALLIGSDYFPGIKGIGPITALSMIKKHGRVERVIVKERKCYDFSPLTAEIIAEVRKIFLLPETISPPDSLHWSHPDESHIKHLMCVDHHLNEQRVSASIEKLVKHYETCQKAFNNRNHAKRSCQKTLNVT